MDVSPINYVPAASHVSHRVLSSNYTACIFVQVHKQNPTIPSFATDRLLLRSCGQRKILQHSSNLLLIFSITFQASLFSNTVVTSIGDHYWFLFVLIFNYIYRVYDFIATKS